MNSLALKIKQYRRNLGKTSESMADELGIDRSYLSKMENNRVRPSHRILIRIINYFNLPREDASELFTLAGYKDMDLIREGVIKVQDDVVRTSDVPNKEVTVNMPNSPVLYSDSAFVTTNDYGLVIDFAQGVGPTNQQNIVSRVGMSYKHAEALLEVLKRKIEEQKKKER